MGGVPQLPKTMGYRYVSRDDSTKRAKRWRRKGKFHSKIVTYPKDGSIPKIMKRCAKTISDKYMVDQLKAPMGNPPKPDSVSRASNNYYFGQNLKHGDNPKTNTVLRAAYAVGSGSRSIGLNPKTFVINQMFPDLAALTTEITRLVRAKTEWRNAWFSQVSVKVYYSFLNEKGKIVHKFTNWHVDVTTTNKSTRVPDHDNTQTPGSPVAILTFGDEKSLLFRRQCGKDNPVPDTEIEIPQRNGTLVILDGRDEYLDCDGSCWWHKSSKSEGVTFSFMFRNVRKWLEVDAITGKLADPGHYREKCFAENQFWWDTEWYKQQRVDIEARIQKLFS